MSSVSSPDRPDREQLEILLLHLQQPCCGNTDRFGDSVPLLPTRESLQLQRVGSYVCVESGRFNPPTTDLQVALCELLQLPIRGERRATLSANTTYWVSKLAIRHELGRANINESKAHSRSLVDRQIPHVQLSPPAWEPCSYPYTATGSWKR